MRAQIEQQLEKIRQIRALAREQAKHGRRIPERYLERLTALEQKNYEDAHAEAMRAYGNTVHERMLSA